MDAVTDFLRGMGGDLLGGVVQEVLIPLLLLLGLFVLASPIYLVMKWLSPRKTTFRQDLLELVTPQPRNLSPEREQLLSSLNAIDRGVSRFYEYFLYIVMVLATVFAATLYFAFQKDSQRDFLFAYFGVGYVLVMLLLAGQVAYARYRRRRASRRGREYFAPQPYSSLAGLSDADPLGIVSALPATIRTTLQTSVEKSELDESRLEHAQALLDAGLSFEEVCAQIESQYASWDPARQQFFAQALRMGLTMRRGGPRSG